MLKQHVYNNELVVISTINKHINRVSITVIYKGCINPIKRDIHPFVYITLGTNASDFYSCDVMQSLDNTMHVFATHYTQALQTQSVTHQPIRN